MFLKLPSTTNTVVDLSSSSQISTVCAQNSYKLQLEGLVTADTVCCHLKVENCFCGLAKNFSTLNLLGLVPPL